MPTKVTFMNLELDYYEVAERYEQLRLGLDRLAAPIYSCMPDDLPGRARFQRIVDLIDKLDTAVTQELELMHGEKISPDAPMISKTQPESRRVDNH